MARKPRRPKRRVRDALRVYPRAMRNEETWWWVAVPGAGRKALHLPCATVPFEEARRVACERYAAGELVAGGARAQAEEASVAAVIKAWDAAEGPRYKPRSRRSYKLHLVALQEYLEGVGVTRPSGITDEVVAAWVVARQAPRPGRSRGTSNATINRAMIAARVCFGWAASREPALCGSTGFARAKDLREIGRVIHPIIPSPDEWRRCVAAMLQLAVDDQFKDAPDAVARWAVTCRLGALLVASAVETGMRLDELRHQRAQDVRAQAIVIAAHDGWSPKSWHERTLPCAPTTAATVRAFCAARDARPRGVNNKVLKLGDGWIADLLDRAWKRAGLPGEPPRMHDARRTFATATMRGGGGLDRIRVLLGHRDVATTERYLGRYRTDVDAPVMSLGVADVFEAPTATVLPMVRR
jgi:site-specific recombinase XerD